MLKLFRGLRLGSSGTGNGWRRQEKFSKPISVNPDAAVFTRKLVASIEQRMMLEKDLGQVKNQLGLSRDVGCFYRRPGEYEEHLLRYPVKSPDGRELGLMFIEGDLKHVYLDAERKIKWPDDWIDLYPTFIDMVSVIK